MSRLLSKSKMSDIKSLSMKKFRDRDRLFVIEGNKIVDELINVGRMPEMLIGTEENLARFDVDDSIKYIADEAQMAKLTNFKTPPPVIAVVSMIDKDLCIEDMKDSLTMAIDNVQDPGNLGTIIRICDWFGIKNIVCSIGSADVYNPKTIQATMGAFLRVNVFYADLPKFVTDYKAVTGLDSFGTFLNGENIYNCELPSGALIVMGSEGRGISDEVEKTITKRLFIPPINSSHVESLNLSVATAITCNEFRRNLLK